MGWEITSVLCAARAGTSILSTTAATAARGGRGGGGGRGPAAECDRDAIVSDGPTQQPDPINPKLRFGDDRRGTHHDKTARLARQFQRERACTHLQQSTRACMGFFLVAKFLVLVLSSSMWSRRLGDEIKED